MSQIVTNRGQNWYGTNDRGDAWLDDLSEAPDTARMIADYGVSITVRRGGVLQAAQPVVINPMSNHAAETLGLGTTARDQSVLIVGYLDHATIADTDIQRDDTFFLGGRTYVVTHTVPQVGDAFYAVAEVSD